jgi:hypothetical protein
MNEAVAWTADEYEREVLDQFERVKPKAASPAESSAPPIAAKPFAWPDPATIPPRQFLHRRHYIRRAVGATIGGGGRAKTTLGLTEAISMTCGRDLLTGERITPLRVWDVNGEEDQDELDRRVTAICQRYGVSEAQCGGRLFVQSVRDKPIRFAIMVGNAPRLDRIALDQFEEEIRTKQIDVFMIDPLVSFHSIPENDNGSMDLLLKEGLGGIASRTNSAGEVFHHPGKPKPGQADTTVEDARGASAIIWAVRSARVLNFMTIEEAAKLGIGEDERRLHIRVANGKANMGPIGKASWFKLDVEKLANGDEVACAGSWKPPNPFEGVTVSDMELAQNWSSTGAYRADPRSPDWLGYKVAEHLRLNVSYGGRGPEGSMRDIAKVKQILAQWLKNGVLATETRTDDQRKKRRFIVPGSYKPNPPSDAEDAF